MKHLTEEEERNLKVSLPQPLPTPENSKRPSTAVPTPGSMNPKPKEEPKPEPKPATPPPPPTRGQNLNPDLVKNTAENRATAIHKEAPHNPYRPVIEQGDEASRGVLRERDKEDYEYAQKYYLYQPDTGDLFSKKSRRLLVATTGDRKRKVLNFKTKRVYQHDLAYLLQVGHWPEEPIRHIRDSLDNRWDNLRLQSHWTPAMKPATVEPTKPVMKETLNGVMSVDDIEEKAPEIPRHVLEGRKYLFTVKEIVDLFEFRAEGPEGMLISKKTGREVAKPKVNSKGRHRVVFITGIMQVRAHIISYILYHRKFPKGNLGARDGNKCNIHPSNLQPLWAEKRQDV